MKIKTVCVVLLATAAASAGCSGTTGHAEASYAKHYDNVSELKADSSLVVEVTAKDMSHTHREGGSQPGASVLLTDSIVTINRVLYDPRHQVTNSAGAITAATVYVYQTGGGTGADVEIADDPIFKKGEHLLLFLRNGTAPLHFVEVGGPGGRFKTSNGKVEPFNNVSAKYSGTEDNLAKSLASATPTN